MPYGEIVAGRAETMGIIEGFCMATIGRTPSPAAGNSLTASIGVDHQADT